VSGAGRSIREALVKVVIQLAHRLGHCAEKSVCPGIGAHIGTGLEPGGPRRPRDPVYVSPLIPEVKAKRKF
jgi:hypothetical protein